MRSLRLWIILHFCITLVTDVNELQIMNTPTLSFRATSELAAQTKALAKAMHMSSSDYVREAVREKNERALKDRMLFLSAQLSARHLTENQAMDASTGDGLA